MSTSIKVYAIRFSSATINVKGMNLDNMKKKNVLQILNYSAVYRGNFIDSLAELGNSLKEKDIQMSYLFCSQAKDGESYNWIKEMKLSGDIIDFYFGKILKDIKLTREIIKKHNISIVHVHFFSAKLLFIVKMATIGKNVKIILHFHNHPQKANNALKSSIRELIYKKCILIGVSHSVFSSLKRYYPRNTSYEVENAIKFSRIDTYETLNRKDFGLSDTSYLCLIFGFDYYRKGVDIAIKAISAAREAGKDICLMVSLSTNHSSIKETIESEFGGFPDWIKLVKARNDVASYYYMADAFLSPSREEGFCYSVIEAAYCGCTVIASRIPAQEDLVVPESKWFESENIEELAELIREAADNKTSITEEQIIQLRNRYNISKWVKQILRIYKKG